MKTLPTCIAVLAIILLEAGAQPIPKALEDWKTWAIWEESHREGKPQIFNQSDQVLPVWYSPMNLKAGPQGGSFTVQVRAFADEWVLLPGDGHSWPQNVMIGGVSAPVLSREGMPCVKMTSGLSAEITGEFRWSEMPQYLPVPQGIGVLSLVLNDQPVELPVWDPQGRLWLQRTSTETTDKDFLSIQVYRLVEDGSPQWLRTQVELSVAGKSREEVLGHVLPEGWRLSSVEAPIPCAVDDAGQLKVQVRAGKWVIKLSAYRTSPAATIGYAQGTKPLVAEELVGLKNQPGFRLVEISGIPAVDVAQTTYPQEWRQHPVHQWPAAQAFQLDEKMRGMGMMKPPGISIRRSFWLDEDGRNLTYQDELNGQGQQTWRLDVAGGHKLGAVKIGGSGQLITKNPGTGAEGVEVRDRNLNLQAVGRVERTGRIAATGWQKDAESLDAVMNLPPGWRLLAVFGADWSDGDWLTSWSLFDVFMLLMVTLAVWRLWGWKAGTVTLVGVLVIYHEARAPLLSWVILVAVLAASRLVKNVGAEPLLRKARAAALLLLAFNGLPFMVQQVQQAIFPQLEPYRMTWQNDYGNDDFLAGGGRSMATAQPEAESGIRERVGEAIEQVADIGSLSRGRIEKSMAKGNLSYDTKAKIQTGPAVPQWKWRQVSFGWRGPVSAQENIRLLLISSAVERLISLARVGLSLGLLWLLFRPLGGMPGSQSSPPPPAAPAAAAATVLLFFLLASVTAQAQFPSPEMLQQLRDRVLAQQNDLPQRAEIPQVKLTLQGHRLEMEVEIHSTGLVAVPLPGRLPSWSPLSVGEGVTSLRHDGHLWVLGNGGTQVVKVSGLIPPGAEWQWSFLLKPRQVVINAPGWNVTGLKPNGVPEDQVFFVEQNRRASSEAAYDQKDFFPVVSVVRELELGLIWQVRTKVQRLSPTGKAIALNLPLLPGERVLSAGMTAEKGRINVRFGAADTEITWESELQPVEQIQLLAEANDHWVERWSLVTSPIWNVQPQGLAPVYEAVQPQLVPVWTPWPGESVQLAVSRPEAVQGATTTVHAARQETRIGDRQRTSTLNLQVQASLGEDFGITLPAESEITSLRVRGQELPVRREGGSVIIPLRPGDQELELGWKTPGSLGFRSKADAAMLPVFSSNITTTVQMPESRWLLWADGPVRGPAVRFWGLLVAALLLGLVIGRAKLSPLRGWEWAVLLLGFLQLPLGIGVFVVLWFFALAWRGENGAEKLGSGRFNALQVILAGASILSVLAMLAVVHQGLLGRPEMFVAGYGSTTQNLQWFQDRTPDGLLPQPAVFSVSIWVYRGLMLLWALWMARSVLRWIPWAYEQLLAGGGWKKQPPKPRETPPPLPTGKAG